MKHLVITILLISPVLLKAQDLPKTQEKVEEKVKKVEDKAQKVQENVDKKIQEVQDKAAEQVQKVQDKVDEKVKKAKRLLTDSFSVSKIIDLQFGFLPSTDKSVNNYANLKIRYSPSWYTEIKYSTKAFQHDQKFKEDTYNTFETKQINNEDHRTIKADLLSYSLRPKMAGENKNIAMNSAFSLGCIYREISTDMTGTTPWSRAGFKSVNTSDGTLKSVKILPSLKAALGLQFSQAVAINMSAGFVLNFSHNELDQKSFYSSKFFLDSTQTAIESASEGEVIIAEGSKSSGFSVDAEVKINNFLKGLLVIDFALLRYKEDYKEQYTEKFAFYDDKSKFSDTNDTFEEKSTYNEVQFGLQYEMRFFQKWGIIPGFRLNYSKQNDTDDTFDFGLILKY